MRLDSQSAIEQFFQTSGFSQDAYRKAALKNFFNQGLPHRRVEDWKYTSVRALAEQEFKFEQTELPNKLTKTPDFSAIKITFQDGVLQSLPEQAELDITPIEPDSQNITKIDSQRHPFAHLNHALTQTGVQINIPKNTQLNQLIHLVFIQTKHANEQAILPRVVIHAGAQSSATIIEHYLSESSSKNFVNTVSEVNLATDATLNHYLIQEDSLQTFSVHGLHVKQQQNSQYNAWTVSLGSRMARNDIDVQFVGEGASASLNGLYLPGSNQHVDNHTFVHHDVSHCQSAEHYKGIIGKAARAVFNGKVLVKENTIQTVANQMNKNLLLAEDAEVDTKPELEIYADDVICSHGATVGQLDDDAIFYFRARGIAQSDAKKLLMHGFAAELLDEINLPVIKDYLMQQVQDKLNRMSGEC